MSRHANSSLIQPAAHPVFAASLGRLPVLLVFSHLRWSFVYQRPQHLLSKLAGRWHIVFIEEPMPSSGHAHVARQLQDANLEVWVPHTPVTSPGFHDDQQLLLGPLITRELVAANINPDAVLLYTPMALPLSDAVAPGVPVFYDCMDDLSAFMSAPRQLRHREAALMDRAAAVITGGPSLYEAKLGLNPNVHCVPSAVDAEHYDPRRLSAGSAPALAAAALQDALPRPRMGYFGVIDERLDLPLIDFLAASHPEWHVVMAGPVVKIDPAALPQRPNLSWLGMQPYDRLPYLLAGWDVALMPFALNDSTRSISPTKTLEYLAGEKPVVSTAVRDVISLYGHVVEVAIDGAAFVAACEMLLAESTAARCRRELEWIGTVSMASWDRAAHYVDSVFEATLRQARWGNKERVARGADSRRSAAVGVASAVHPPKVAAVAGA